MEEQAHQQPSIIVNIEASKFYEFTYSMGVSPEVNQFILVLLMLPHKFENTATQCRILFHNFKIKMGCTN
jgi:hypothetical protein